MSKNGFTLIDTLLALFIISCLSLSTLNMFKPLDLNFYYFMSDYLYNQALAINKKETVFYNNLYSDYPVIFNSSGSVNMAQTVKLGRHKVIIHLGTGYLSYE